MNRRDLLRLGGLAAVGFGVDACAPKKAATVSPKTPARPPFKVPLVNVSYDRIIRQTVGLRPHRPTGFRLGAEKLDAKTIVHNFGHGGSGMSLSWGTASMATDLALAADSRRAAVLGCGVVGLTSARELQRKGFEVTIYAENVPPNVTSNMSLAGFTPTSGLVTFSLRTPAWDEQFRTAVRIAYRRLQLLVGPKYGITWIPNYNLTNDAAAGRGTNQLLPDEVQGSREMFGPGEHPFPTQYCLASPEMRIEPSIYLDALVNDFLLWGGKIVVRKFESPRDVTAISESVIINCTGLGAKGLFGDPDLVPLKGQLILLTPQPEIQYATSGGSRTPPPPDSFGIHMMPRSDGIALGGTQQRDVWTMDIDEKERMRVVDGHIELFTSMGLPQPPKPSTD